MFDVSFSELAIVGTVALLVLGPEKLPKVAKAAGEWVGKAQRYVSEVKGQINREIAAGELKNMRETLQNAAQELRSGVQEVERDLSTLENEIVPPLQVDVSADPYHLNEQRPQTMYSWRPRRKKMAHKRYVIPKWYKQMQQPRTKLLSGAARMQRHKH
ncbi:Sec-independent protein translocase protein TatB [Parvibium lacunae]|uniref:Sec-independent protein translocase protein TatB n=1 Tax=Parvibium lacunae TaxID=1888893 RepID=A0A368L4R6_9BURK|nr:Sec-independent protein translocase protein TatB [Parvibium lacunae]RCS58569.1 Sec-independent protein translocase subunit TatB [Parvibium lacunae]